MSTDPFEEIAKREKEAAALAKREKDERTQWRMDLKKILLSPEGQRVFYKIIDFSGVWRSTVKVSSEIYVKSGAAQVGFEILENIQEVAPEAYLKIMQIKFEKEKQDAR